MDTEAKEEKAKKAKKQVCCFCAKEIPSQSNTLLHPDTGKVLCEQCIAGMFAVLARNIMWPGSIHKGGQS